MSWYTDPQLFMCYLGGSYGYYVYRVIKKYDVPLVNGDLTSGERLDFSKHLSLGNNKESDYDALKSCLAKNVTGPPYYENVKFVNCQGLVGHWDNNKRSGIWSTQVEELTSIINSLPGIVINPCDTKLAEKLQALEKKNSELIEGNSNLQEQLNQEKSAKLSLEKKVLDLTAELEECRWNGDTIPDHWVPFENLDVMTFPRASHLLAIMEGPNKPTFVEEHDSIFYSLPGITNPFDTVLGEKLQAVEKRVSELVAEVSSLKENLNNEVTKLQEQLNQEKNDKKALLTQVLNLTAKLEECCGAGGGSANVQPWMSGDIVPDH
ncbi:hypothetical protein MKX03_027275 [Papaver bracteatum]|nr:hypothetical protein MKX03_027275 [Papaver bracteatum]